MSDLKRVFGARSVAVVGASASPEKTGHIILRNIVEGGFGGKVYPVNPKAEEILGLPCYPSLSAIPGEVDLAVVVVPSKFVPSVVEEGGKKGIKGAVIISGGFSEIGNEELEESVKASARKSGVRLIGPNCQGFNYTPNRLCASWPLVKAAGPIAVISQSGTIGATMEMWAEREELGISAFVALGNKCDVSELDLIDHFAKDPNTRVISLYLEGFRDGRSFMELVRNIGRSKPVVVLKPGRSEKGQKAVQSHTHSIAGRDEVFQGVCRQLGIARASDVTELYDFSKALGFCRTPRGRNMLVVTSSGGCGIIAADTAQQCGIDVVELGEGTKTELKLVLPPTCVVANPMDLTGDTDAGRFSTAVEVASKDPGVDFFLLIFGDPIPGACEAVERLREKVPQEIVVCYLGGGDVEQKEVQMLHQRGIPVFPTPTRAVKAAAALLASHSTTMRS